MELKRRISVNAIAKNPPIFQRKRLPTQPDIRRSRLSAESSRKKVRREWTKEERESAGGNNSETMVRCSSHRPRSQLILAHQPQSATAVDAPTENSPPRGSSRDCSSPHPAVRVPLNALPPTHDTGEALYADSRCGEAKLSPPSRSGQLSRATQSTAEIWQ